MEDIFHLVFLLAILLPLNWLLISKLFPVTLFSSSCFISVLFAGLSLVSLYEVGTGSLCTQLSNPLN